MERKIAALLGFFLLIFLLPSRTPVRKSYTIVGCTVVNPHQKPAQNMTIILRNGIIERVGPSSKVKPPADAEVIEGKNLTVYPGFIDALNLSLTRTGKKKEQKARRRRWIKGKKADVLHPERKLYKLVEIKESTRKKYLAAGITAVHIASRDEIIPGTTAVLNLNGRPLQEALLVPSLFLQINFNQQMEGYPVSLMGISALLRQLYLDTHHYWQKKLIYARNRKLPRPVYNEHLEYLKAFFIEKAPILFLCRDLVEARIARRLAGELGLNWICATTPELWRRKENYRNAALILTLSFRPPMRSIYSLKGEKYKKEAEQRIFPSFYVKLYREGFRFAFASFGLASPADFLKNMKKLVKAGLSEEAVLEAATSRAAEVLGLTNVLGSVEEGKIANLLLVEGNLLKDGKLKAVFVDGYKFEIKKAKAVKPAKVNVTGRWAVRVSSGMGEFNMVWHLKQEGNEVTGTIEMGDSTWRIPEGTVSGNEITLTIEGTSPGGAFTITFSGKIEGDRIVGTLSMGSHGEAEVIAVREPEG